MPFPIKIHSANKKAPPMLDKRGFLWKAGRISCLP